MTIRQQIKKNNKQTKKKKTKKNVVLEQLSKNNQFLIKAKSWEPLFWY